MATESLQIRRGGDREFQVTLTSGGAAFNVTAPVVYTPCVEVREKPGDDQPVIATLPAPTISGVDMNVLLFLFGATVSLTLDAGKTYHGTIFLKHPTDSNRDKIAEPQLLFSVVEASTFR